MKPDYLHLESSEDLLAMWRSIWRHLNKEKIRYGWDWPTLRAVHPQIGHTLTKIRLELARRREND